MDEQTIRVIIGYVFIDLLFSFIAACVAFAITYNEYVHHYPNKIMPVKLALDTATTTFIVFVILGGIGVVALTLMT
jgi:hypothetical protein